VAGSPAVHGGIASAGFLFVAVVAIAGVRAGGLCIVLHVWVSCPASPVPIPVPVLARVGPCCDSFCFDPMLEVLPYALLNFVSQKFCVFLIRFMGTALKSPQFAARIEAQPGMCAALARRLTSVSSKQPVICVSN
jgi:hypothetical protein